MKRFSFFLVLFSVLFLGCSDENGTSDFQQEFFSADIDGEQFAVDHTNGNAQSQKVITNYGSINLFFKVERSDGKKMEFLIQNYTGAKTYPVVNPDISREESIENMNWMNFTDNLEGSFWSTRYNQLSIPANQDHIEITEDNGMALKGRFSFIGHKQDGTSSRRVTNGNFKVNIDR